MVLYTGSSGGCYSTPVCISERPLCWLIRHLKQRKKKTNPFIQHYCILGWNVSQRGVCGGADLVAGRLVWLLLKAQAEEGEGNRGEQGHRREEGDGMRWTCEGRIQSTFCSLMAIDLGFSDSYRCCGRTEQWRSYLIWAWRRRAARTCRGREPRWPGWWPPCGCAGWVWWERMHSRCCIGRPCAWGLRRVDLEGWKKTRKNLLTKY